jgi:hypothetical protein
MNWQPGGFKQADRVSLHFLKCSVDCSLIFFQSEELEKYIRNFGPAGVPVILMCHTVKAESGQQPFSSGLESGKQVNSDQMRGYCQQLRSWNGASQAKRISSKENVPAVVLIRLLPNDPKLLMFGLQFSLDYF